MRTDFSKWLHPDRDSIPEYKGERWIDEDGEEWVMPMQFIPNTNPRAYMVSDFLHGQTISGWIVENDSAIPNPRYFKMPLEATMYMRVSDGRAAILIQQVNPYVTGETPIPHFDRHYLGHFPDSEK